MSVNKCPFCGEAMITTEDKIVVCENADCATMFNEWDYPKVCAAMELATAAVWAGECEGQRDYMDDVTSNRDAWRSIVNLDIEANDEACRALERCEEVFNA